MTEDEARAWVAARHGDDAVEKLARFATLLRAEASAQSLVAASTIPQIWVRHIVDSAQLFALAPGEGRWLDIGSGAGLPGLVIAILRPEPILLAEPRRKRAEFLARCADTLALPYVTVKTCRVELLAERCEVISARAVAAPQVLLTGAHGCAETNTTWLFPRGTSARADLDDLRRTWHGSFHVEQSITQPGSGIIVATGVARR